MNAHRTNERFYGKMDKFATNKEKRSVKDVVLLTNADNTTDRIFEKRGSFKGNKNYKDISANNQKLTMPLKCLTMAIAH